MICEYNPPDDALVNKIILITGAGSGIGKAAALTFAQYGATVILLSKTKSNLTKTSEQILALGESTPRPIIIPIDLNKATLLCYQDIAATIQLQFGRLDGLLFNAAILGDLTTMEKITESQWDEVMQVNLKSQFLMLKALLPVIKLAKSPSILFTSSSVGKQGRALWGSYAISKFATEGMMQVLADEHANSNLRCNTVNPGAVNTKMRAKAFPFKDAAKLKQPKDIMLLYLYLMSCNSKYVTGQAFDAQPKR